MIEGPCTVIIKPKERLYLPVYNLILSNSAFAIAYAFIVKLPIPSTQGANTSFPCVRRPLTVKLHASTIAFEAALHSQAPGSIHLNIVDGPGTAAPLHLEPFSEVVRAMFFSYFIEFFESYKDWMYKNINKDRYQWPAALAFGAVIRDAMSHNRIRILSRTDSVTWCGLSYSHADRHDPFNANEITFGDLLLLWIEISAILDSRECPIFGYAEPLSYSDRFQPQPLE